MEWDGGEFYTGAIKKENWYETLMGAKINWTIWLIKLSPTRREGIGFSAAGSLAMHEDLLRELHSLNMKNK